MDKTGWPAGLLQDDDKKLSRWFAGKPDARHVVRNACALCDACETVRHCMQHGCIPLTPMEKV